MENIKGANLERVQDNVAMIKDWHPKNGTHCFDGEKRS